eukprot:350798-Hanusia_phi.AAC.1
MDHSWRMEMKRDARECPKFFSLKKLEERGRGDCRSHEIPRHHFREHFADSSPRRQVAMCIYSGLFMRFAWKVTPRNYLLLACHISNETVQATQLSRKIVSGRAGVLLGLT